MDSDLKASFIRDWEEYFPGEPLPITFEFSTDPGNVQQAKIPDGWRCLICDLKKVRAGTDLAFDRDSITCRGGRRYCGYDQEPFENFRYFLSSGIEGELEGERYKRTPEIVDVWQKEISLMDNSGKYIIFRRWDHLSEADNPSVVIFFVRPESLSGLFSLANFSRTDAFGVITPMGAGCSSLIHYPMLEQQSEDPRAVLGMMDPSARPCVPLDTLTFAVPMRLFTTMIQEMGESFLITPTWKKVEQKIEMSNKVQNNS
jgi:uncharacterized protein (DUF169 family)